MPLKSGAATQSSILKFFSVQTQNSTTSTVAANGEKDGSKHINVDKVAGLCISNEEPPQKVDPVDGDEGTVVVSCTAVTTFPAGIDSTSKDTCLLKESNVANQDADYASTCNETETERDQLAVEAAQSQHSTVREEAGMNEFERQRMERIKRNQEVMQKLGLGNGGAAMLPNLRDNARTGERKASKRIKHRHDTPREPLRRSKRHARDGNGENVHVNLENVPINEAQEDKDTRSSIPVTFEDSRIKTYIMESWNPSKDKATVGSMDERNVNEFKTCSTVMIDGGLSRAYSIDWVPGLVASGGKNGHVSIWGSGVLECPDQVSKEDYIEPLLSDKLHKGWVSDVQFMKGTLGSNCPKLVTASNDAKVCVWDISLQVSGGRQPKQVFINQSLHSQGIFSMDFSNSLGMLLTASKDGSVALSTPTSTDIFQQYPDLHDGGVVKCARWRNTNIDDHIFASCGNDGLVKVVDSRCKAANGDAISFCQNDTVVSYLKWHPSDLNVLLSASNSPYIDIHDLRMPKTSFSKLQGHSRSHRISGLYQPIFVNGGHHVLTAGDGPNSKILTMYDMKSGDIISQGDVGWSLGASFSTGLTHDPIFFSGSKLLSMFYPVCFSEA